MACEAAFAAMGYRYHSIMTLRFRSWSSMRSLFRLAALLAPAVVAAVQCALLRKHAQPICELGYLDWLLPVALLMQGLLVSENSYSL